MSNPKVAYRYAKSLLDLATERGEADVVEKDLAVIVQALDENRDLRVFMNSPVVKSDKKEKVLDAIFGGRISILTSSFVRIITSKGRERLLHEVAGQYLRQIRVKKGIMTASVVTATPLDNASRIEIHRLVTKLNENREIVITETIDPEIIGGFVLKVEDKMVDASVLSHFRKLRMEFTKNLYEAAI